MRILIFASQNALYLPLKDWLKDTDNQYVLFIKKEHVKSYLEYNSYSNFTIYDFSEWDTNKKIEQTVIELHREMSFDKLISVREADILRLSKIREYLGIDGQKSKSANLFRDKYIMKSFVKNIGLRVPFFNRVSSYIDVLMFTNQYGYPVVIKPIDGAGSVNTFIVKNELELNIISDSISFENMIVETFVGGDVYHIDGLVLNDEIKFISPSKYINDCLSYKEGKSTASIFLTKNMSKYEELVNYGKKIISEFPTPKNMTFHLEVFINKEGITFCEIACRTGGGRIAECIEKEFGMHLTKTLIQFECGTIEDIEYIDSSKWSKNRGWILSSPLKGILKETPEEIPFNWVFDYWKFAQLGTNFNGSNSSVFSIAAFCCEADSHEDLIVRLNEIDFWYKKNCRYIN